MLTNLIAAVTTCIVTNTTELPTDFEYHEPAPCPEGLVGCLVSHWKGINPTAKLITTETKEVTEVTFTFGDKPFTVKHEKIISSSTKRLERKWIEVPIPPAVQWTNVLGYSDLHVLTNAPAIILPTSPELHYGWNPKLSESERREIYDQFLRPTPTNK